MVKNKIFINIDEGLKNLIDRNDNIRKYYIVKFKSDALRGLAKFFKKIPANFDIYQCYIYIIIDCFSISDRPNALV